MIKQVIDMAWDNRTPIDNLILIVGLFTLVLICILAAIKASSLKTPLSKRKIRVYFRLSSLYQWGIEVCPLLGTLGTVVALIYQSANPDKLQESFLFALTSTLWGIVMAILCKLLESLTMVNAYFEALEEKEILKEKEIPVDQEKGMPKEKEISAAQEKGIPKQKEISANQKKGMPKQKEISAAQEKGMPKQKDISANQEKGIPKQRDISANQEKGIPKQKDISADQKKEMSKQKEISANQEKGTPKQKDISANQKKEMPKQKDISANQEETSAAQEKVEREYGTDRKEMQG